MAGRVVVGAAPHPSGVASAFHPSTHPQPDMVRPSARPSRPAESARAPAVCELPPLRERFAKNKLGHGHERSGQQLETEILAQR